MCKVEQMTSIECRTVGDHKSPKETGVDVECSLERGLVCQEKKAVCPDFEIRVHCQCEGKSLMIHTYSHIPHFKIVIGLRFATKINWHLHSVFHSPSTKNVLVLKMLSPRF